MTLLVLAIIGIGSGYLSIWMAVQNHKTVGDRVGVIITGVLIDAAILVGLSFFASGDIGGLTWTLICKYFFLSIIDFNKTLRQ